MTDNATTTQADPGGNAKPAKAKKTPADVKPPTAATTATPDPATSARVLMTKEKDCKHVVKYSTDDEEAIVQNVYVAKTAWPGGMPDKIAVFVQQA